MRVLIIGHACSPRLGSEPSFTWNWAWHLSRHHQVWVLAHPHDRSVIEQFLVNHPNNNLQFHWLDIPRYMNPWHPLGSDRGLRLHYMLWLRLAYDRARELHEQIGFHIAHHVSYGSVSAPPPVWKLGVPFIWGPIGGGQKSPGTFRRYFGSAWAEEIGRNARVRLLRYSPSLRSTARASHVTLATNHDTYDLLRQVGACDVRLCLDSGIPSQFVSNGRISSSQDKGLTLLWAGRMQRRKALPLALEALAEVRDLNVTLLIAGDGEMRGSWERCSQRLYVKNKVEFLGRVPWHKMPELYQRSDAFLFTSLRDSFGTQVLEAMAHGLPILTLDHQGVGTFVPPGAGIKIPVTNPPETISAIADGIRWLARNPDARRRLGEAGHAYAQTQTWERRAEWMSKLYEEAVNTQVSPRLGGPAAYGSYAVKKRMEKIDQTLDLRGKRLLDLGCGNGCYTTELTQRAAYVCGVDIQLSNLMAFRQPIPRIQAAGENLPFPSESFDVVTMIEVLEHTSRDDKVMSECFRVLKPKGVLALFVPNKLYPLESHPCHLGGLSLGRNLPVISWFPESLRKRLCHARIYTRRKLLSLARNAGFQNHRTAYIYPPLDSFPLAPKESYRRAALWLENTPLARFGVSIYAAFEKPATAASAIRLAARPLPESPSFKALGVRVDAVQLQDVVTRMEEWIHDRGPCHSIAATSMHGIVEAQRDPSFKRILSTTDLNVPDGTPLVWMGRRRGHVLPRRVYGPDLLLAFCEATGGKDYRHFFYGGEPGVAERLVKSLQRRFPGMQIAGTFSPPFRSLNDEEEEEIADLISNTAPDIVWVALGTPKQERWMHEHKSFLRVPLLVGVGAAFNMLSGRRRQAPRWMRERGLECLFRLMQEPRRLWRRYLVCGAQFITYLVFDLFRLRDFNSDQDPGDLVV